MRLLVTTRADRKIKDMTDLTHPIIKKFAREWKADFSILDHVSGCDVGNGKHHYRIMKLYDLLSEHDRVLVVDSDVLINKNCPNLFEVVPHEKIGTIYEDRGSRERNRRDRISQIQKKWGNFGWTTGYINTGIFIVSKSHREMFRKINGEYWTRNGFDDVHLGYQIRKLGLKVFELDYKFNHMSMFSEPWNGSPSRFDSYIIHYAGGARFPDKGTRSQVQLMMDDIKEIYKE